MNAPYDGDRGRGPGSDHDGQASPPHAHPQGTRDPYAREPYPQDPYAQEPYAQEPYPHNPYAQEPYGQQAQAPDAYPQDPYAQGTYPAQGGYAQEPYPQDPYAQGSYAQDGYDPYQDPYAQGGQGGYAQNPYAQESYSYNPYNGLPYVPDPYTQDYTYGNYSTYTYAYPVHNPYAHDPLTDPLYDQGGYSEQPGGYPAQQQFPQQLHQQPTAPPQTDPRLWGEPAQQPGTDDATRHLRHYDDATAATQYLGTADQAAPATDQQQDAFAHLFRDQQPYEPRSPEQQSRAAGPGPATGRMRRVSGPPTGQIPVDRTQNLTAQKRAGGRAGNLLKSSAVMAAGTLVSRLTGFLRQMVIVAALGAATLGDTYAVAFNLPAMIYFLTVGGGLNSVFVPQLVRAMKEDDDGGVAYANRLLTLVMVALGALVAVSVFAAPWLIRMMSPTIAGNPASNEVAVTFARYCLPTIFFMGVHVVVGQVLNARGRFGAMMWTPVLNNIVVITTFGLFIWVFGTASNSRMGVTTITPEGIRLLGIGTLLGLVVQSLAMFPYLRAAGFRFRPRFDWRGHGLGKAARLAKWTVLFVLANQAGVVVVTQLATAAGSDAANAGYPGTGYISYSSAQLIWNMPQAIITVSVMAALLPRISRAAHDGDPGAVRDDISQGLRTSAVAIVPISFAFVALGVPLCTLLFGTSGTEAARSMGYTLMAFGLGLIPFSVQYVVLRGFYAFEDTRTPFYNTVIVAAVNAAASALCYLVLPARWAVAGMAASYGLAYATGVGVAWRRLRDRLGGDLDGRHVVRTYTRLAGASVPAAVVGGIVAFTITGVLGEGPTGSMAALVGGGLVLLLIFYAAARRMRIQELTAMVGMVRGRLGR
ncbi:murein biosynthesis integral membrane protein MurJ [Streptomyces sp. B1866]|uniref:murein biosynthesis integral membrane protein MurJ n=1 Tax=Streptomyces sp. B1866 TaxID=3075431 RepID=UPI002891EC98|nr:murein biosynthesis integral membrane protein MurJ [Streptomyces sp. B1866]MDT3395272.1 murein biosynthesis integral membrane protein MurJ [Streptomyces sp. B1866]